MSTIETNTTKLEGVEWDAAKEAEIFERLVADIEFDTETPNIFESKWADSAEKIIGLQPTHVPVTKINAFFDGQTRRDYDAASEKSLAESIKTDDLYHPLMIAELSPEDAERYIQGINEIWRTEYSLEGLETTPDGNYLILIAGHRRLRAIHRILAEMQGKDASLTIEEIMVTANAFRNITLTEALKKQVAENRHRSVPPYQEAYAIRQYFDMKPGLSVAACGRELGFSKHEVETALAFSYLPLELREYVTKGFLNYNWAVEFAPMIRAYHRVADTEGRKLYSNEDVLDECTRVVTRMVKGRWNKGELIAEIKHHIEMRRQELAKLNPQLLRDEPEVEEQTLGYLQEGLLAAEPVAQFEKPSARAMHVREAQMLGEHALKQFDYLLTLTAQGRLEGMSEAFSEMGEEMLAHIEYRIRQLRAAS